MNRERIMELELANLYNVTKSYGYTCLLFIPGDTALMAKGKGKTKTYIKFEIWSE